MKTWGTFYLLDTLYRVSEFAILKYKVCCVFSTEKYFWYEKKKKRNEIFHTAPCSDLDKDSVIPHH